MALREQANKKKIVPALVAVVLFCIAGTVTALQFYRPVHSAPPVLAYFYDLTNDQLFAAKAGPTPMVGPSGSKGDGSGTAVWAHVYSCGDCAKASDRYLGYLENRNSEAPAGGPAAGPKPGVAFNSAAARQGRVAKMVVADPADKKTWLGKGTVEGQQIISRAEAKCGEGNTAQACVPTE